MSDLAIRATGLSSATVHEAAGRIGALPSNIKPVAAHMRVCGPAFPVKSPPGDNLHLHHAIYAARPGNVLVVDCGDGAEFGYWGEVMSVAAHAASLGGLVITGGVRDSAKLGDLGFPVFAGNVCIRGTGKDPLGSGSLGARVRIGDVEIAAGDIVIGDADGVVVIPAARFEDVLTQSRARDAAELGYFDRLRAGETTLQIYDLPPLGARK
jgi:4-hydroxy-4-methyl-2-oxoglutarate aldolase